MKLRTKLLASAFALALTSPASATIVSVSAGLSSAGTAAAMIAAPADVSDDAATNTGMQGFDEVQNFLLTAALDVDGAADIAAGTRVNSHMLFLNSDGNAFVSHTGVTWDFDGMVLGTMSDLNGTLEAASNSDLGNPGTIYPGSFSLRGLENNDNISFLGNSVTASFTVSEPGDWVRVITAYTGPVVVNPVPVPAALPLFGTGLAVMGFVGWRRKRKTA